ncbi:hypothetical protein AAMO2058_000641000 [Amorphochlora amoebiformis]
MDPLLGRAVSSGGDINMRSSDLELIHKKINGFGLQCRQQQIEIHELRCSVRKYKTMLDNMQDEIRMIRQILDKKWMASPRSGRAGDGGYYNDKEGGKQRWRGGDTAITHEEIVELACTVLRRYPGGMAIAKLGTLMHKEANNHALPSILKERYGGLKKFLQGQQDKCVMGNDHPYNPHVTLRSNLLGQPPQNYSIQAPRGGDVRTNTPPPSSSPGSVPPNTPGNVGALGEGILDPNFRRAARRRRTKKRGSVHSPPVSPRDLIISGHPHPHPGAPAQSPAAGLLHNTQLLKHGQTGVASSHPIGGGRPHGGGLSWSGVVSAPGTPLAANSGVWTGTAETTRPNEMSAPNSSRTPEAGIRTRSSSLFTSAISTRLRTNVLKSAYIIRLPPYTGGSKLTRIVALCCGFVEVGVKGGDSMQKIARAVVVNLYGHVLFDEFVRPIGEIIEFNTKLSGVRSDDMKRATSLPSCRQKLHSLLTNRIVVSYNIDRLTRELKLPIPKHLARDTRVLCSGSRVSLPKLAEDRLGLSVSARSPTEDARAAMAIYWSAKEEMERIAGGATPTGNSGHTMSSTIVTPAGSAIAMDGGGSREGAEAAEAGSGDKGI